MNGSTRHGNGTWLVILARKLSTVMINADRQFCISANTCEKILGAEIPVDVDDQLKKKKSSLKIFQIKITITFSNMKL